MDVKKLALATVAGGAAMWLLAGLWHMVLMVEFYAMEGEAQHEGMGIIIVAYLVLGLLMAHMYPPGYKGGRPWVEGLRFGVLIGIVWVLPHGLAMVGAHGDSISYELINGVWHMVEQGVGGVVVAIIYGPDKVAESDET